MLDIGPAAFHGLSALQSIYALCERAWPAEACGIVVDGRVLASPDSHSTERSFRLAPRLALALERASRVGRRCILWHAHTGPSAPAGMSADDVRAAAPQGEPLHPRLVHVVVDLRAGPPARAAVAFAWDGARYAEIARVSSRGCAPPGPARSRPRSAPR